EEGFGAVARPFHRPADLARRPKDGHFLRIGSALGTEPAPYIRRNDTNAVLVNAKRFNQEIPEVMGILKARVKNVTTACRIVLADCRSRLQRIGRHALIYEFYGRNVVRL